MEIVFLLLPIALALGAVFVIAFVWATQHEQFEDLETPSLRILIDEPIKNERDS